MEPECVYAYLYHIVQNLYFSHVLQTYNFVFNDDYSLADLVPVYTYFNQNGNHVKLAHCVHCWYSAVLCNFSYSSQ